MSKRIVLVSVAGAALLAFGGTAVALAAAEPTPTPTATTGAAPTTGPTSGTGAAPTADPAPTDATRSPSGGSAPAGTAITAERAKEIALARTGDDRVDEVELETEHGRQVWEVETVDGTVETDVHVDAQTGEITRERIDTDDDGDDNDADERDDGDDD